MFIKNNRFVLIGFVVILLSVLVFAEEPIIDKSTYEEEEVLETMVIEHIGNGYIQVDVDMDGDDGNAEEGGDLGGASVYLKLTYGWPNDGGTQWFMFYVDGTSAKTQNTPTMPASDTQYVVIADNRAIVQWHDWNGVLIREEFTPVSLGATPGQIEQIKYKFVMKPVDGSSHSCGAMVFFDTMINTNDAAPISTSFGYSTNAEIYYAPGVPTIWRAYQVGFPPGPGEMQALGILTGYEATMPDVFWYGQWGSGVGLGWNTAAWAGITGGPYTDSATMIKWEPRTVASTDSVVFVTYFGIGNFTTTEVSVTHNPPTVLPDCDGTMNPDTTHFNFFITNGGTGDICNVVATLDATGFNHLTILNPLDIGTLSGYGGSYMVDWDVFFDPAVWGTTQEYIFTLTFDDCAGHDSTIVDTFYIDIPHPSDLEVIVTADDTFLCAGDTIQLHASFTGEYGTADFSWSPAYAISDIYSLDPYVYPDVPNMYYFTVTDSNGCIGTGYVYLTVSTVYAEAGYDATVCSSDSVMIGGYPTGLGGFPPYTYSWTPAGFVSDPAQPNPYAKPDTPTMFYVEVTDAYDCIGIDSVFIDLSSSPYAYIILPDSCGGITSCNPPSYEFIVNDSDGTIDPGMFTATVNGVPYDVGSGVFSYIDSFLTITLPDEFANGTIVVFELTQYMDFDACRGEAITCTVIVDSEPPLANMTYPTPGSSILDPVPTILIQITDTPAGIDTTSFEHISVYLNGTPVTGFGWSWSDPTLQLTGFDFAEGGTVMVCLDSLWDSPDYPYCPPNDTSYCWTFVVTVGNVIAYPVEPLDMQSTACDNQILLIHLEGSVNPVDPATVVLIIDDAIYTVDSSMVNYDPVTDEITFDPGGVFWADNDTVCVSLWAADIYGGAMEDTMTYCFVTDFSPPYVFNTIPAHGEIITVLEPSFQFDIADDITGIDSFVVTLNDSLELRVGDPCVTFDGTLFSFDASCAGLTYTPDTPIEICVNAWDSPDLCDQNELDTCWTFTVSMLCSLVADAGADIDLCVGSDTVLGGSPVASNGAPPYIYQWTLPDGTPVSSDEEPVVSPTAPTTYILTVTDSLGCIDSDTIFVYAHNCAGPVAAIIRPLPDMWSSCDPESIFMGINDPDGVVESTIVLDVNGIEYTTDSSQLAWSAPNLVFVPSIPFTDGTIVTVSLISADDIFDNPLESAPVTWQFLVDYSAPVLGLIGPAPGAVIPDVHPSVWFQVEDSYSGVDTFSIEVWVGSEHFVYGDTCFSMVSIHSGFHVEIDSLCLAMTGCDTFSIRVVATDSTDYCDDNILDTSWTFYTDCEAPLGTVVYPPEGAWYSCDYDSIIATIFDDAPGVDTSSLAITAADGAGYFASAGWGHPSLNYDIISGQLIWIPSPSLPDIGTITITVNASDYLGNAMTPLEWSFYMDRIPPDISEIAPVCGDTIFTVRPDIFVIASDDGCGDISVELTIDGIPYTDLLTGGDTIYLNPASSPIFAGGDEIEICWTLTDCADDLCPPNSTDTCCTFYVAAGGPVAIIHNPNNNDFVACDSYAVLMTLYDTDGILPESLIVLTLIDGSPVSLTIDSSEISYALFDDSMSVIWTPTTTSDGMTVTISVASAYDSLFNELAGSDVISFIFDFSPPEFTNTIPIGVVEETTPEICVDINDGGSGVDWSLVEIDVESVLYDTVHSAVSYDVGTGHICFDPAIAGITWSGGDTIDVCIHAADSTDTCGPNESDTCWNFIISPGGPWVICDTPTDSAIVACITDSVIWLAADPNGINWNPLEIVLWVGTDSQYYTAESGEVFVQLLDGADSIAISLELPTGITDGTMITACLVTLPDSLNNPIDSASCITFYVDYNPPDFAIISPGDGDIIHETQPPVIVSLGDYGSGVNIPETYLIVNVGLDSDTYYVDGSCLSYFDTEDSLVLDPVTCGIAWTGGTDVEICLHSEDYADSEFCGPNELDTCWDFSVASEAPLVQIERPGDSTVTSCSPDTIIITFFDPDSIDAATIRFEVNGTVLDTSDDGVIFRNDSIIYIPTTPFADGMTVNVCLTEVSDLLGNALTAPVCVTFFIDYSPPYVELLSPQDGGMVRDRTQDIVILLIDQPAGIDSAALVFTLDGVIVAHNDLLWTPNDSGWTVRYIPENNSMDFPPGDSVIIEFSVTDTTDYCANNAMDTIFFFMLEPEVGCYLHPNPFTPNTDGTNDFAIFDYPNMFSEKAELIIFDMRGIEVYRSEIGPVSGFEDITPRIWNGEDNENNPLSAGIYLYAIVEGSETVCNGTVVIVK